MKKHEMDEMRSKLERAEGIIIAHVACSQSRTIGQLPAGTTNTVVGRTGGRVEIVLDSEAAVAFAAWLETRVQDGDK